MEISSLPRFWLWTHPSGEAEQENEGKGFAVVATQKLEALQTRLPRQCQYQCDCKRKCSRAVSNVCPECLEETTEVPWEERICDYKEFEQDNPNSTRMMRMYLRAAWRVKDIHGCFAGMWLRSRQNHMRCFEAASITIRWVNPLGVTDIAEKHNGREDIITTDKSRKRMLSVCRWAEEILLLNLH